jgi:hypothetical protein
MYFGTQDELKIWFSHIPSEIQDLIEEQCLGYNILMYFPQIMVTGNLCVIWHKVSIK